MLGFIQRYQKVLFYIVAIMISVSFLFFGMLPKGGTKIQDKVIYRTFNKQKIRQSSFDGLKAVLSTNAGEYSVYGKALGPHFFTENFVSSDLLKTGILNQVAQHYLDDIKEDLHQQHAREKKFKAYVHPQATFLNADSIWSVHAPKLKASLDGLKLESDPVEAFKKRTQLYLEESQFSSFTLWQILSQQESQFQWIPRDQNLNPQALSLFGYQSLEDWFGDSLMRKTCEYIFDVTALAKEQGYGITQQEAEQDLLNLNEENFKRLKSLGVQDFANSEDYLNAKLRALGIDRVRMVQIWKDLLTFRRFYQEAGNSALLDSELLKPFESHAAEKIQVAHYQLPQELHGRHFKDLMELEVYLEALGKPLNQLSLQFKPKEIDVLAREYPNLVERPIDIEYKEVSFSKAALSVKVQDIWDWKLDPNHFDFLASQFPKLKTEKEAAQNDLQDLFENLDTLTHMKIDQKVREILLKKQIDWLDKAMANQDPKHETLKVRRNGQGLPFKGLELSKEREEFVNKFFKELETQDTQIASDPITFDHEHYYQIVSAHPKGELTKVSFKELKEDRTLQKLLSKKLKASELSEEQAAALFDPLKEAIKKDYLSQKQDCPKDIDDDFYCTYRFYYPMRKMLEKFKENPKSKNINYLNELWVIEQAPRTYIRYLSDEKEMQAFASLQEGQWTSVYPKGQTLEFSQVTARPKLKKNSLMQKQFKQHLNGELQEALTAELFEHFETKR